MDYKGKDETALRALLDDCEDFEERRKIRAAIRDVRKQENNAALGVQRSSSVRKPRDVAALAMGVRRSSSLRVSAPTAKMAAAPQEKTLNHVSRASFQISPPGGVGSGVMSKEVPKSAVPFAMPKVPQRSSSFNVVRPGARQEASKMLSSLLPRQPSAALNVETLKPTSGIRTDDQKEIDELRRKLMQSTNLSERIDLRTAILQLESGKKPKLTAYTSATSPPSTSSSSAPPKPSIQASASPAQPTSIKASATPAQPTSIQPSAVYLVTEETYAHSTQSPITVKTQHSELQRSATTLSAAKQSAAAEQVSSSDTAVLTSSSHTAVPTSSSHTAVPKSSSHTAVPTSSDPKPTASQKVSTAQAPVSGQTAEQKPPSNISKKEQFFASNHSSQNESLNSSKPTTTPTSSLLSSQKPLSTFPTATCKSASNLSTPNHLATILQKSDLTASSTTSGTIKIIKPTQSETNPFKQYFNDDEQQNSDALKKSDKVNTQATAVNKRHGTETAKIHENSSSTHGSSANRVNLENQTNKLSSSVVKDCGYAADEEDGLSGQTKPRKPVIKVNRSSTFRSPLNKPSADAIRRIPLRGSKIKTEPKDYSSITDERVLENLLNQSEDYSEKRKIREALTTQRQKRLQELSRDSSRPSPVVPIQTQTPAQQAYPGPRNGYHPQSSGLTRSASSVKPAAKDTADNTRNGEQCVKPSSVVKRSASFNTTKTTRNAISARNDENVPSYVVSHQHEKQSYKGNSVVEDSDEQLVKPSAIKRSASFTKLQEASVPNGKQEAFSKPLIKDTSTVKRSSSFNVRPVNRDSKPASSWINSNSTSAGEPKSATKDDNKRGETLVQPSAIRRSSSFNTLKQVNSTQNQPPPWSNRSNLKSGPLSPNKVELGVKTNEPAANEPELRPKIMDSAKIMDRAVNGAKVSGDQRVNNMSHGNNSLSQGVYMSQTMDKTTQDSRTVQNNNNGDIMTEKHEVEDIMTGEQKGDIMIGDNEKGDIMPVSREEDVVTQEKTNGCENIQDKFGASKNFDERRDMRTEMRELRKDIKNAENQPPKSPPNVEESSTKPAKLQSLISIDESSTVPVGSYSITRNIPTEDGTQQVTKTVSKTRTPSTDAYEEETVVETTVTSPGGKAYETTDRTVSKRQLKKSGSNYFQRDAFHIMKIRDAEGKEVETTDIVSTTDAHSATTGQRQTETVETTIIKDDGSGKDPMIEAEEVILGSDSDSSAPASSSSSPSSSSSSSVESESEEEEEEESSESEESGSAKAEEQQSSSDEQESFNEEDLPEILDPILPQTILDGDPLILTCKVQAPDKAKVAWYHGNKLLKPGGDFVQTWAMGIASLAIGEVFPDDEGEYRCIVRSGGGEAETSAEICIKANSNLQVPKFSKSLEDVISPEGTRLILGCTLTGSPQPQIQWFQNGLFLRNNADFKQSFSGSVAKLVIPDPDKDDSGVYVCVATSPAGEAKTTCQVTIKDPHEIKGSIPTFRTMLVNIHAKEGNKVMYEVKVSGDPQPKVTWYKSGTLVPNCADFAQTYDGKVARMEIAEVFADDAGTVKCVAKNVKGEASSVAKLTVKALAPAPVFAQPLRDLEIQDGGRGCLQCSINGATKEASVVWYKNGKVARPGVGFEQAFDGKVAKYVISQVFPDDQAKYECVVKGEEFEMRTCCLLKVLERPPIVQHTGSQFSTTSSSSSLTSSSAGVQALRNGSGPHSRAANFSLQKFLSGKINTDKAPPTPPSLPKMPAMQNVEDIDDEELLHKMLSETQEFDERRVIRARLREIREQRTAEFAKKRQQREQEDRQKQEEQQRKQAVERERRASLNSGYSPCVYYPAALQSNNKKTNGDMSESSEEAVFRSTKTEKVPGGGSTTTTTTTTKQMSKDGTTSTVKQSKQVTQTGNPGKTNIVITKTSADKCAKRLATVFAANGYEPTSGVVSVRTEGWTSNEGTINRHEKTVQWGGGPSISSSSSSSSLMNLPDYAKTSSRGAMAAFKQMDNTNNPGGPKPKEDEEGADHDIYCRKLQSITNFLAANYVHRLCRDQWVVNGGMLEAAKYEQSPYIHHFHPTELYTVYAHSWQSEGKAIYKQYNQYLPPRAHHLRHSSPSTLSPTSPTGPGGVMVQRSPSAVKQMLLDWTKRKTEGYDNVSITNFSSSWNDGMAFCALMHHFYPRAFDYKKLNPKCRRGNFKLAFDVAEKLGGVAPLLDVDDMVKMKNPDWKCVFTYVQSLYRRFREEPVHDGKKEEEKKEEEEGEAVEA